MKIYAKNPAELVIENPSGGSAKRKKGKKKMAKRKRGPNGRFKKTKKSKRKRSNPSATDEFVDTGKNLFMQYALAALAATGTVKAASVGINKIPSLPAWAKEWLLIGGPAVGGIIVSMVTDKKSAIAQGVAGGMVLASVNGLSDKLLTGSGNGSGGDMADVAPGDLIIKADGFVYDQDGNRIAALKGNAQPALPASSGTEEAFGAFASDNHLLGDFDDFGNSWEESEAWTP